jgi:hypothetical protein
MSFTTRASIDTLRSIPFANIAATYAGGTNGGAVGVPFAYPVRLLAISNNTNGDMFLTYDPSRDMLFVAANSFKLFDVTSNRESAANVFVLPIGTQFYVRYSTAPTMPATGAVYIEAVY